VLVSIFASENYRLLDDLFNPIADSIYTIIFLFTLLLAVLVNLYLLIPLFLRKKLYVLYLLGLGADLFAFSYFNQVLFAKWIDYILPDFYFISYYDYWDIVLFFAVFLLATTLIKLSKEWFELNESRQRVAQLEKEKAEIELKALTGQINPHFLFNSLNVLYSLALKESRETPSVIIKLSEILRYVIYEAGKDQVYVTSEIELIQNYLDLQKFRVDATSSTSFKHKIEDESVKIAPMLLLPLVENSFKHGVKADLVNTFVDIDLQADKKTLNFTIENNKGNSDQQISENQSGGIGLKNIANRLQLLYPDKFTFEIKDNNNKFRVELTLQLKYEN
jgi:sensor histidine kinase YesM